MLQTCDMPAVRGDSSGAPAATATALEMRVAAAAAHSYSTKHRTEVVNITDVAALDPQSDAALLHIAAADFAAVRVLAAPIISDIGQPLAVLTLTRGHAVGAPTKQLWEDDELAPFSTCVLRAQAAAAAPA